MLYQRFSAQDECTQHFSTEQHKTFFTRVYKCAAFGCCITKNGEPTARSSVSNRSFVPSVYIDTSFSPTAALSGSMGGIFMDGEDSATANPVEDISKWSVEDVCGFISSLAGCAEYTQVRM